MADADRTLLGGASLREVNLAGADLRAADLSPADLTGAKQDFDVSQFGNEARALVGAEVNLDDLQALVGTVNLTGANLTEDKPRQR
ncbi:MAG: hypothetical protein EOP32_36695 [Rhodococcus sp. (in: high G+C Gram-positive bacteria)]|nr:MAG: hypothetical protein EOP32_36695 [Rhodococcus sp. (in: high G+C Gram-positive bacteria)]